ncbi:MAG TPA: copper resistance protein NlpE N-terminal domain-containing protein [Gammaproteobacteria bacterium]|nr:copper resistance protein NlpE N-terminal domain-containing protein [Gammaproteobacteria bacterium]
MKHHDPRTPMHGLLAAALLVSAALAAGCGGGPAGPAERITPAPADLSGVYAGDWPCSNCRAIKATLWLRPDHRFVLRQSYVGGEDAPPSPGDDVAPSPSEHAASAQTGAENRSYSIGLWRWDEHAADLALVGAGPERRFSRLADGRLELHTLARLPHDLVRLDAPLPFTDVVRLEGETAVSGGGATFKECATGLTLPIVAEGELKELRRKHRLMNSSGKPALTELDGHLREVEAGGRRREVLVVDRVIALNPRASCSRG